jgi:hypothetical protein
MRAVSRTIWAADYGEIRLTAPSFLGQTESLPSNAGSIDLNQLGRPVCVHSRQRRGAPASDSKAARMGRNSSGKNLEYLSARGSFSVRISTSDQLAAG